MAEFQKKLEDRRKKQDERLSASMDNVAAAVMGKRLSRQAQRREVARFAIEEILKYYGYHLNQDEAELPETVEDTEEMLDFFLRPYGMMYRRVSLEKDWYKNSVGAMLGRLKEDGTVVALLPGRMRGYSYLDPRTEKRVKVDRRTRERIDTEAVCFYKPLPQRALHISDLLMYIRRQISLSDGLIYFAMIIVPVLLGLMSPMFTQWLFGKVLNYGNVQVLLALAVFMVSFSVCRFFVNVCKSMIKTRLYTKQDTAVEAAVMNRMVNLPTSFFKDYSAGEIQQRSAYIGDLCRLLFETVADTGLTALFSLMYIGQVFTYTPALAVPSILVVAATASVLLITTLMQMRDRRKRMRLHSELSGMTYSMITGIQKVKLTGSEKTMMSRWARLYADEARVEYNPPTFLKLSDTITLGISLLGTLAIYAAALGSHIATADYYAFNTAYGMMMAAVSSVSAIAVSIANIKTTFEMTKPILETQPETSENREAVGALNGEIDIQHVTFRYQDDMPNVLDDFSLHISPGEYIAIVGTTGCGKSTLMRLLLGFETPQKGAVYYDRRDISKVDIKSLRRRIGVVMQDGRLFQGDILTNITISSPHATVDDAWDAAEKAAVADDIRELPMGMYTMVAEGQGGLSGGQRQRLLIARAIAAKPSVLMFDEATSALDNATQKKVSRSIDGLGCTRLVIAHRLSTIRNADRIVALDKGRIIEDGTYDELIAKNGFFAELIRRQRLDTEEKAG